MRKDDAWKVHSTWKADMVPITFPSASRILTAHPQTIDITCYTVDSWSPPLMNPGEAEYYRVLIIFLKIYTKSYMSINLLFLLSSD